MQESPGLTTSNLSVDGSDAKLCATFVPVLTNRGMFVAFSPTGRCWATAIAECPTIKPNTVSHHIQIVGSDFCTVILSINGSLAAIDVALGSTDRRPIKVH
jgi:hypothetical protein